MLVSVYLKLLITNLFFENTLFDKPLSKIIVC